MVDKISSVWSNPRCWVILSIWVLLKMALIFSAEAANNNSSTSVWYCASTIVWSSRLRTSGLSVWSKLSNFVCSCWLKRNWWIRSFWLRISPANWDNCSGAAAWLAENSQRVNFNSSHFRFSESMCEWILAARFRLTPNASAFLSKNWVWLSGNFAINPAHLTKNGAFASWSNKAGWQENPITFSSASTLASWFSCNIWLARFRIWHKSCALIFSVFVIRLTKRLSKFDSVREFFIAYSNSCCFLLGAAFRCGRSLNMKFGVGSSDRIWCKGRVAIKILNWPKM